MTQPSVPTPRAPLPTNWPVLAVSAFIILMLALRAGDIFAGTMPDNDDMMRLQQVRDLMAGQNWFNVDQTRLITPEGGQMHWSRLPDIFLSTIIFITRPLLGQANAEALAATLWPLTLLGVALASIAMILRRIGAGLAGQIAGLVFFTLSAAIYNFWPGRIDHHNLVVTLTLVGLAAAMSPRMSLRSGIVAAICIGAMLSVAIESLPYAGGLILTFGLYWIVRGHQEASRLVVFGLTLSGMAALFYLLDAPGLGMRRAVCDAYGSSHFAGLVGGGLVLAGLGSFGGGLETWWQRLVAGALSGLAILGLIVLVNPACLGDPYANVSEQVRLAWLSAVGEARTLPRVWADEPARVVWQFGFILAALGGLVVMLVQAPQGGRMARTALAIMMVLSGLATVWQIRGVTFSHVFAALVAGWVVGVLFDRWRARRGVGPVLALAAGALLVSPTSWKSLSGQFERAEPQATDGRGYGEVCRDPAAYVALDSAPRKAIFSPIDLGTSILLRTPHSIFAAPYHRNVQGIDLVTDVFMGPTNTARAKMLAMGADHMVYCRGLVETTRYGDLRPDGFAAALNRDEIPDWLEPVDSLSETDGTVRLYRIKSD